MSDRVHQSNKTCVRALISGRVQGVGYRYSTVEKARELGVEGWVRNLPDGRVEALFAGDRAAVEQIVLWCHQGPTAAVVRQVNLEEADGLGIQGFTVRYSSPT